MISKFEFEKELNDRQLEAVLATDGPLLILAGAGSGKTRVLMYKIAWLIEKGLARPNEILAVTFTNKAADEMKSRIGKMLPNCIFPYVNTFHSFCVKVLSASHLDNPFNIYDDSDKKSLLKDIIKQMDLSEDEYSPAKISSVISNFKNKLQEPENIEQNTLEAMNIAKIYQTYLDKMKANNAFDFDDLIINGYKAFKNDEPFADKLRNRFKYVLIDEYQDINIAQYMLVQEICRNNKNITVVGDDDQSIYRFRGADMSIMLRFEKDYPNAKVVRLEQNYRSTGKILEAANALMTNNKMRKKKTLWTDKGDGEKINLMIYPDGKAEAHSVVMKIKELIKQGEFKYGDFAVLYRTNSQSRLFEESCRQEGIPYKIIGANSFYNAKEIKDITAYLHLVLNKKDNVAFKRIINVPKRGLGDSAIKRIEEYADASEISLFEAIEEMVGFSAKQTREINEFIKLINETSEIAEKVDAYTAVKYIIEQSKIKESFYNEEGDLISAEYLNREANVDEFINSAQDYITTYEDKSLAGFLTNISLQSDLDHYDENEGTVSLMTFHLTKGLEFPVVFLTGIEENVIPHFMATKAKTPSLITSAIEEERRLFYVGITRAEKLLFMTYALKRMNRGIMDYSHPSRFLSEIPDDCLKKIEDRRIPPRTLVGTYNKMSRMTSLKGQRNIFDNSGMSKSQEVSFEPGDQVKHLIFGKGIVLSTKNGTSKVDFLGKGTKTIVNSFLSKM